MNIFACVGACQDRPEHRIEEKMISSWMKASIIPPSPSKFYSTKGKFASNPEFYIYICVCLWLYQNNKNKPWPYIYHKKKFFCGSIRQERFKKCSCFQQLRSVLPLYWIHAIMCLFHATSQQNNPAIFGQDINNMHGYRCIHMTIRIFSIEIIITL